MKIYQTLFLSLVLMNMFSVTANTEAVITGKTYLAVGGNSAKIILGKQVCFIKSFGNEKQNSLRIEFTCNGKTQTLFNTENPTKGRRYSLDDPKFSILWAGDKDNDGKIDLVMEMSPKYSYSIEVTYLSSKATKNQLLGISSTEKTEGC